MNPEMKYSRRGLALTERFEGCRLEAYLDVVGVPTIGYGHTRGVHIGMMCTQQQAQSWLEEDTQGAQDAVNRLVMVDLAQPEFDALVDFVFNLGAGAFEHSTLLKLLNAKAYQSAAEQFDRWAYAGGHIVAGLLRRRHAEEVEFLNRG